MVCYSWTYGFSNLTIIQAKNYFPFKSPTLKFTVWLFKPPPSAWMNATKFPFLQALVVQTLESAIHRVKIFSVDNAIVVSLILIPWIVIYPGDSAIQSLNNWHLEVFYSKSYMYTVQVKNKILHWGKKTKSKQTSNSIKCPRPSTSSQCILVCPTRCSNRFFLTIP